MRDIHEDEFYFVIKILMSFIQEARDEEYYEGYLNDLFFNN